LPAKKASGTPLRSASRGGLQTSVQASDGSAWCYSPQLRLQRLILERATHSVVRVMGLCCEGGFRPGPVNAILLVGIFQNDNNFPVAWRAHFASPALLDCRRVYVLREPGRDAQFSLPSVKAMRRPARLAPFLVTQMRYKHETLKWGAPTFILSRNPMR
jgi:hypothetical protein